MLTQIEVGNIVCLMLDTSEGSEDAENVVAKIYFSRLAKISLGLDGALASIASNIVRLVYERGILSKKVNRDIDDVAVQASRISARNLHSWIEDYQRCVMKTCESAKL